MIVPHERLAADTLTSLIESFVMREGTDYGAQEVGLEQKVDQVRRQVLKGEVLIVFDYETETINLLPREEVRALADAEA